MYVIVVCKGCV